MVFKTIDQAADNLKSSTSFIPERYEQGVRSADWATNAGSDQSEKNFADGVNKAIQNKSRQKGIKKVSNSDWQNKSINIGKNRIASGITENIDKYKQNYGVVHAAVESKVKSLPPRTNDPMANIDARLKEVVKTQIAASPKNK